MSLPQRTIGKHTISAIGYGCMGLSAFYAKPLPDEERLQILDEVYKRGVTHWDTADGYGDSEELLRKWFTRSGKRSEIFLATKFGLRSGVPGRIVNGDPAYVRQAIERSLQRLGVDSVELYYLHRADPDVPIEKTVEAMAELVKEGKVKYLGLSEISESTLRRAHAVHPITAIQVEYSPFTLDIEDPKIGLLKAARELGVAVVAYAPLGRGLITGEYTKPEDFEESDYRRAIPRYSHENFPRILKLAAGLKAIGERHNVTAGQVALAWLLAQGPDVLPIPGTTKLHRLHENLGAASLKLTAEDIVEVRKVAQEADTTQGERYPPHLAHTLFGDTPALEGWVA
ncbi:NADP-dependent oxidoreductase domain-containing protein [Fomitopsis serialis]|uniref:NADP-dependent oxidoreductase domain-containing protein n=1 Tax=Fomitopsis serialis TaxID=139415 RepID=UPI002008B56D|nr:NADP-dependent oxidoreductase domain-containing protein [Neoantrodia serialis]KAH9938132.1 NADP-dependent oxidoreductase domain-containing protein [Neoantrodia serialis]